MLTRLRQLVLHPGLVPANYLEKLKLMLENEDAPAVEAPAIKVTAADEIRLQGSLAQAIEDNEECPICFGILSEPRITSCSHYYCLPWYVLAPYAAADWLDSFSSITEVISRDPKCPMVCDRST